MKPYKQCAMALDVTSDEDYKQAFKTIPMPKDPVLIKGIFDSSALNTLVCLKTQV